MVFSRTKFWYLLLLSSAAADGSHWSANPFTWDSSEDHDATQRAPLLIDTDLFVAGEGGYACYRLPNLLELKLPGHLLALAQGRKHDCGDVGWMDIVQRRSVDNGVTWSAPARVYSISSATTNASVGPPAAVVDRNSGFVHLLTTPNFTSVVVLVSKDEGATWSAPRDLSSDLVPATWSGVYTGLPQGIQLRSGRLIVCANHLLRSGGGYSHTIYSDDRGATWSNGNAVAPSHMGECSVVEINTGGNGEHSSALLMYARVWWDDASSNKTHALAVSMDGATRVFSSPLLSSSSLLCASCEQQPLVFFRVDVMTGFPLVLRTSLSVTTIFNLFRWHYVPVRRQRFRVAGA